MRIPISIYGLIARIINLFVPVKPKHWIFGADYGNMYREGSKYLLEYMLEHHKDYHCTFITRNRDVKLLLDNKGIPCEMNFSLRGMIEISQADSIFTCQVINDVYFAYRKKHRSHYYLVHGQPLKKAFFSLDSDKLNNNKFNLFHYLTLGVSFKDIAFVSATSNFLKPFMEKDFGYMLPVKILGMPRNDVLFDHKKILSQKWIDDLNEKFVVTYMPTHRKYGNGDISPIPFLQRQDYQQWMRNNNVVLLVKQHPNMIPKLTDVKQSDVIRDITCDCLDPQVCLYHSDVLITDFSSVWMDYLLLRRPILFYFYDNFEQDDAGCHYNIRENPPGYFCTNEDDLFNLIKKTKEDFEAMCPSDQIISKYHKYVDGNSCERYFNTIKGTNQDI